MSPNVAHIGISREEVQVDFRESLCLLLLAVSGFEGYHKS